MRDDQIAWVQRNATIMYAAARDAYGWSSAAAHVIQASAAEMSMHERWLRGVEASCVCTACDELE